MFSKTINLLRYLSHRLKHINHMPLLVQGTQLTAFSNHLKLVCNPIFTLRGYDYVTAKEVYFEYHDAKNFLQTNYLDHHCYNQVAYSKRGFYRLPKTLSLAKSLAPDPKQAV